MVFMVVRRKYSSTASRKESGRGMTGILQPINAHERHDSPEDLPQPTRTASP